MWHDSVCNTVQEPTVTSIIVAKKTTTWGESGFPSEFLGRLRTLSMVSGGQFMETPVVQIYTVEDYFEGRRPHMPVAV